MTQTKIGLIGCGNISGIYFKVLSELAGVEIVACADMDRARADAAAQKYKIPASQTMPDLLASPDIDIVLNLTPPAAHAEVALAALAMGKSVYNEKPLAIEFADAQRILAEAAANGLRVGCAPDTFLGAGLQTCRRLIDDGVIGRPVAATAFMLSHGPERWHPDPEFFYKPGAGPLFDMGPYYLTALISLLGPVANVTGSAAISFAQREIGSGAKQGQKIEVETPTHVTGLLDFASGATATMITSFDVWASTLPRLEIYGSEGTLLLPDPNFYDGPVRLRLRAESDWREMPLLPGYTENSRGLGVADMARAIREGRPHRASGEMALHVLEIMHAILESAQIGRRVELQSSCERPAPFN
ncbi:MAG: Gfo/Idh/MocA family oxidoreductase [Caldilineales bacterium]|nr:Gfo/Idh/MocA family oxidoreductase [Caldilineales bacterium]